MENTARGIAVDGQNVILTEPIVGLALNPTVTTLALTATGIASTDGKLDEGLVLIPSDPDHSPLTRRDAVLNHEMRHVFQGAVWGPFLVSLPIPWLVERGYRRVGIVGTSVGSCIGFLALAHDDRFSTGAFIHASGYFADVVWTGLSTKHVRRSLESGIDLEQLRYLWSPISPNPFIKRLQGTNRRILMIAGRHDPTFLPELSQEAHDEFDRCRVPHEVVWLPCGHYTMGQFPFNALVGYRIVRFLGTTG